MAREVEKKMYIKSLVKIIDYSTVLKYNEWFITAPADSINRLLKKCG